MVAVEESGHEDFSGIALQRLATDPAGAREISSMADCGGNQWVSEGSYLAPQDAPSTPSLRTSRQARKKTVESAAMRKATADILRNPSVRQLEGGSVDPINDNDEEGIMLSRQMTAVLSDTKGEVDGICLTGNDLQNKASDDSHENHERSQDILHQVLRRRGVHNTSRAPFTATMANPSTLTEALHLAQLSDCDSHDDMRVEFTQRIFNRLKQRGIHGIRTLRVMLHNMDENGSGLLPGRTFEGALTHMGIRLKNIEYQHLCDLFVVGDRRDETIDYVQFLAHGIGNWATARVEVCQEAFEFLSDHCPGGLLTLETIERKFNTLSLTQELCPSVVQHSALEEFLKQWNDSVLQSDGIITWVDFLDYYLDVSWCFSSHHDFCLYVCKSWHIDMDDWLAKKVFRKYATQETEDVLNMEDFLRMLAELDPNINEAEARAWYNAIDEDDSGEVDLEEFISSKVLKVKRLFDHFDVDNSRTVDTSEMVCILRSLNESISETEAMALYQYADLDGNGDISFVEFLENNLLKLLAIFDEFDKNRGGDLNEAEMKQLLRKLDPFLDDYDIHQIYKAIDTDGGGSITFIEFCESHVLRAKSLFDRYDIDRSRALTQFKFRELMLDMDGTLTTTQMEAIYNLVADQNSGKVTLGGFLNPNIVKLKLLFDKYDQDRSRHLDPEEFKHMLKDLFKGAIEKDVEALQRSVCPEGLDSGISFTMYIQRYKEIARKYDLMQLAKRRQARQKAQNKGLVYIA